MRWRRACSWNRWTLGQGAQGSVLIGADDSDKTRGCRRHRSLRPRRAETITLSGPGRLCALAGRRAAIRSVGAGPLVVMETEDFHPLNPKARGAFAALSDIEMMEPVGVVSGAGDAEDVAEMVAAFRFKRIIVTGLDRTRRLGTPWSPRPLVVPIWPMSCGMAGWKPRIFGAWRRRCWRFAPSCIENFLSGGHGMLGQPRTVKCGPEEILKCVRSVQPLSPPPAGFQRLSRPRLPASGPLAPGKPAGSQGSGDPDGRRDAVRRPGRRRRHYRPGGLDHPGLFEHRHPSCWRSASALRISGALFERFPAAFPAPCAIIDREGAGAHSHHQQQAAADRHIAGEDLEFGLCGPSVISQKGCSVTAATMVRSPNSITRAMPRVVAQQPRHRPPKKNKDQRHQQ